MIRSTSDFAQLTKGALRRNFAFALFAGVSILSAESLESSNPFLPAGYGEKIEAPTPVVQSNGPISREIEFRGLVKMNGQYQFSLFNKRDQKSYWLRENEAAAQGISVRNYDSGSRSLTVSMSGRTERITLIAPNPSSIPVVTSVSQKSVPAPSTKPQNVTKTNNSNSSKTVPRRRVILPKK